MSKHDVSSAGVADAQRPVSADDDLDAKWRKVAGRRSFLKGLGLAGAAVLPGSALFASQAMASSSSGITKGDVAILRLLAAAELIEADLWQQYDEFGGVNGGNPAYMAALANIDSRHARPISISTTTMSRVTPRSSMPTWSPRAPSRSTSTRSEPCPAARRPVRSRSAA